MNEHDIWVALEYRLCHEFAGLPQRRFQHFWCDGFTPRVYTLDGDTPQIAGSAWFCNGQKQAEWQFTLSLSRQYFSVEEVDWASLLPPPGQTSWMSFDETGRTIEIGPSVAAPNHLE